MQNGEWRNYSFISIDEAVLHVIIQNDFLSWNLQHINDHFLSDNAKRQFEVMCSTNPPT